MPWHTPPVLNREHRSRDGCSASRDLGALSRLIVNVCSQGTWVLRVAPLRVQLASGHFHQFQLSPDTSRASSERHENHSLHCTTSSLSCQLVTCPWGIALESSGAREVASLSIQETEVIHTPLKQEFFLFTPIHSPATLSRVPGISE